MTLALISNMRLLSSCDVKMILNFNLYQTEYAQSILQWQKKRNQKAKSHWLSVKIFNEM